MDPLSITVSVLTIIGSLNVGLRHIKLLRDAPTEINELAREIHDFELVTRSISKTLATREDTLPDDTVTSIAKVLSRAEDELLQLQHIFHHALVVANPAERSGKPKYKRRGWSKRKGKVDDIRRRLSNIKADLSTILSASISSDISHVYRRLTLVTAPAANPATAQLQMVRAHVFDVEKGSFAPVDEQPTAISAEKGAPRGLALPTAPQSAELPLYREHTVVARRVTRTRQVRPGQVAGLQVIESPSLCPKWCSCNCHKCDRFRSPPSLAYWLGALAVGYTAPPLRRICNERMCRPRPSSTVRVSYRFPPWVMNRVFLAIIATTPLAGPAMSLKTLRVVPDTEKAFMFAGQGDISAIQDLFSKGLASIYDVDSAGQSLLDMAFNRKHMELCQFLLDAGVDPFIEDHSGWSCIADAWEYAHQRPNTARDQLTIWKSSDLDEVVDSQQLPTVVKIVLGLATLELEAYLQASTASIDDVDAYSRTALYWASSRGDETSARILLAHGANVTIAEKTGLTPLHIADSAAMVNLLLHAGANLECRDIWDRTPLHWACYQGKAVSVVTALLHGGAAVNATKRTSSGPTVCALHTAADFGHTALVDCLLDHGAAIDARPHPASLSPLATAVWRSNATTAYRLLRRGADPSAATAAGGSTTTLLHLAAAFTDAATLHVLLAHADVSALDATARDPHGRTAHAIFAARSDRSPDLDAAFHRLLGRVRRGDEAGAGCGGGLLCGGGEEAEEAEEGGVVEEVKEEEQDGDDDNDSFYETCEVLEG